MAWTASGSSPISTDVRLFRVRYAPVAGRTGFAVVGPTPPCTQKSDCTLIPDYNTCRCLGLPLGTAVPPSNAACIVDPCAGYQAACDAASGACVSSASANL